MENIDPLFGLALGAVLVLFGRRLFWLFVGAAGFVVGREFAAGMLETESSRAVLWIGIAAGAVGAVAGMFLQKLAIAAAGFLAGGYIVLELLRMSAVAEGPVGWVGFVAGGVVGTILMSVLFRWALIVLSSVLGGALVAESLPVTPVLKTIVFLALGAIGVLVQGWKKREG